MEPEFKGLDNLTQEETVKLDGIEQKQELACEAESKPSKEINTDGGLVSCSNNHNDEEKEILNQPKLEDKQHDDELSDNKRIKLEPQVEGLSVNDENRAADNQDADLEAEEPEEEEVDEEEVEKDNCEETDKIEKDEDKSSRGNDNQEENGASSLGRNRRVRQKNRYFLDFHCTDLTKGGRTNRDDYDVFTATTGTRSSNRRSTTDSKQEEPDVFENRYCRKCLNKTPHDFDGGCQACLYKKIVESSKRQRPSNHKSRSSKQQQPTDNEIESPSAPTISNKRKATKQTSGSRSSNNNNNGTTISNNINNNNVGSNTEIVTNINTATINNESNSNSNSRTITDTNSTNKLPRLDSWTPDEVADYILSKGFAQEAELFKTQSVDGISLLLMQRTDFTYGLKIKLGPALKIYDQVCKLKKEYFQAYL